MKTGVTIGVVVGVVFFVVVITVVVAVVVVWKRRQRKAFKRRATTRLQESMTSVSGTIVASSIDCRKSRDVMTLPAGDRNVSVSDVTGQIQDVPIAPDAPIGIRAPPRPPV